MAPASVPLPQVQAVFSTVSALFCLLAYFAVYQRFSF